VNVTGEDEAPQRLPRVGNAWRAGGASGEHVVPVEGGSARDLRATARTVGPSRQLTGLFATPHRPDACAQAPGRRFLSLHFGIARLARLAGCVARGAELVSGARTAARERKKVVTDSLRAAHCSGGGTTVVLGNPGELLSARDVWPMACMAAYVRTELISSGPEFINNELLL
jgi:hypothetical protein